MQNVIQTQWIIGNVFTNPSNPTTILKTDPFGYANRFLFTLKIYATCDTTINFTWFKRDGTQKNFPVSLKNVRYFTDDFLINADLGDHIEISTGTVFPSGATVQASLMY